MARARYPQVPRVCAQCGGHWTQGDGQPPRPFCTTTCRQEAEGRPFRIVPVTSEIPALPTRIHRVQARPVTLTCTWCHAVAEVDQFPGPLPRYCSDACRMEAQRFGAAERMRRMRARRMRMLLAAPVSRNPT